MERQELYDNFIGYCFIEWIKQIGDCDTIVITNINSSRTQDLLFLKIASLSSSIHSNLIFAKMNWFKYLYLKYKTNTNIKRYTKRKASKKAYYFNCNQLSFFERPLLASGASLEIIEEIYNAYYKEFEYGYKTRILHGRRNIP